jgi:GNAT superfamily N-acetyltransferase
VDRAARLGVARSCQDPTIGDGELLIREVRAGDEAAIEQLLGGLDALSRYRRWFTGGVDILGAEAWAAHPERVGGVGLLAFMDDQPVGHAVLIPAGDGRAEVAFEVAAPWRRHGIASALLTRLLDVARDRDLREIYADVLPENADMLAVLREHGEHHESHDGGIVVISLPAPG